MTAGVARHRSAAQATSGPLRRVSVAVHPFVRESIRKISRREVGASALVTRWLRAYLTRGRPPRQVVLSPATARADIGLYLSGDLLDRTRRQLRREGRSLASLIGAMAAEEDPWLDSDQRLKMLTALLHRHGLRWVCERPRALAVILAQAPLDHTAPWVKRVAGLLGELGRARRYAAGAVLLAVLKAWTERDVSDLPPLKRAFRAALRGWPEAVFRPEVIHRFKTDALTLADAIARVKPEISPLAALLTINTITTDAARWDALDLTMTIDALEPLAGRLDDVLSVLARIRPTGYVDGAAAIVVLAGLERLVADTARDSVVEVGRGN